MARKKETNKKAKPIVNAVQPTTKRSKTAAIPQTIEEPKYPAIEIAKNLNVSDFMFFAMKKIADIDDNSFLTISEFQKIQKQLI